MPVQFQRTRRILWIFDEENLTAGVAFEPL
jgi:hypothetical protein